MRIDDVATGFVPVEVAILCAPQDRAFRDELVAHLALLQRSRVIRVWHEGLVEPGEEYEATIALGLDRARLILVLVSANLFASERDYSQLLRAIQHQRNGHVTVMPVVARACCWELGPLAGMRVLPEGGKAITAWKNRDAAWAIIVTAIDDLASQSEAAFFKNSSSVRSVT